MSAVSLFTRCTSTPVSLCRGHQTHSHLLTARVEHTARLADRNPDRTRAFCVRQQPTASAHLAHHGNSVVVDHEESLTSPAMAILCRPCSSTEDRLFVCSGACTSFSSPKLSSLCLWSSHSCNSFKRNDVSPRCYPCCVKFAAHQFSATCIWQESGQHLLYCKWVESSFSL